jgi:hypothetical protein
MPQTAQDGHFLLANGAQATTIYGKGSHASVHGRTTDFK